VSPVLLGVLVWLVLIIAVVLFIHRLEVMVHRGERHP
jgi:uncharacterized membrane protein